MLPVERRSLVIGLLGPAIQALGLVWIASHLLISHWSGTFSTRHLAYQPGVLLLVVGFFVTLVCVPVALEVARASQEDVEIPVYEPERDEDDVEALRPARSRLARYSSERTHPARGPDQ
jgi:hypothetical protein